MSEAEIKRYLAKIGRKGGKSTSPKKLAALKISLKKARQIRKQNQQNEKDIS